MASADVYNPIPFDPSVAGISGTQLSIQNSNGNNGAFFLRNVEDGDTPDVNVLGQASVVNPKASLYDGSPDAVDLYAYRNNDGAWDGTGRAFLGTTDLDPDNTFEFMNVNLSNFLSPLAGSGFEEMDSGVFYLVAVPHGTDPQNLNPFQGVTIGVGDFDPTHLSELGGGGIFPLSLSSISLNPGNLAGLLAMGLNPNDLASFKTLTQQTAGAWKFSSVGSGGVLGATTYTGTNFKKLNATAFRSMAQLNDLDSFGVPNVIVDGKVGLLTPIATAVPGTGGLPATGFSPLSLVDSPVSSRSLNNSNGDAGLTESHAVKYCADDNGDPVTVQTLNTLLSSLLGGDVDFDQLCASLKNTGITMTRRYQTSENGQILTVKDSFSGGSKANHNVVLNYENKLRSRSEPRIGVGDGELIPRGEYEVLLQNATKPTSFIIDSDENKADGEDSSAAGVHTFMDAPNRVIVGNSDTGCGFAEVRQIQLPGLICYLLEDILGDDDHQGRNYIAEYAVSTGSGRAGSSITQVFGQARTIQGADDLADKIEGEEEEQGSTDKPAEQVVTIIRETVNRVTSAPAVTQQSAPQAARTCTVPRLRGRKRLAAERALVRAGCAVGRVKKVRTKKQRKGRVTKQSRRAGSIVAAGTAVNINVAKKRKARRR